MRRSDIDAALRAIYDQIPEVGCVGRCADVCGPIEMHPRERQRIAQAGVPIPPWQEQLDVLARTGDYSCPALIEGRCSVYELRPVICRLWGAAQTLVCPYGCRPAQGGLLSDEDAYGLLAQALAIANPQLDDGAIDRLRRSLANPATRVTMRQYVTRTRLGRPPLPG
ncbi:YkgJ family cysteine cluster protein [Bailinhaonella thermotolerans]|uniref:YkgJ family cysteine cluster protein n=1 Tax=Bailinhaonella thermotolerans TaxID=1070861 RepID=A0A3A4A012_9ACTN|nr:YkgJ family cysteine cluster protein [Bailinhaonella thermotolerans]RJL21048.1 hypothetical protein D5H75_38185 [Bailinhaonella thermotolerans]